MSEVVTAVSCRYTVNSPILISFIMSGTAQLSKEKPGTSVTLINGSVRQVIKQKNISILGIFLHLRNLSDKTSEYAGTLIPAGRNVYI